MKQRELSVWLRAIVLIFFLLGTALFFVILPLTARQQVVDHPRLMEIYWPGLVFLWFTAIPVYLILGAAWRIFADIGQDNSYCPKNAARLKFISQLSLAEGVLYMVALILLVALDFANTGVILLCVFVVVIGVAFSVATASLSHIVEKNCRARFARENGDQPPILSTAEIETEQA